jgi:CO/xanthine dehydrogenase FAD-binding subunit
MPDERWINRLAAAARQAIAPEDDPRISALYRQELGERLVARALGRAISLLHG